MPKESVLTVEQTRWADWVIKLDGKLYSGPYCYHGSALAMARKLAPLACAEVVTAPLQPLEA